MHVKATKQLFPIPKFNFSSSSNRLLSLRPSLVAKDEKTSSQSPRFHNPKSKDPWAGMSEQEIKEVKRDIENQTNKFKSRGNAITGAFMLVNK